MPKFDVTLEGRTTPTTIEADTFYRRDHWVDFTISDDGKGITAASIPEHQVVSILRRPEPKSANAGTITVNVEADTSKLDAAVAKAKAYADLIKFVNGGWIA